MVDLSTSTKNTKARTTANKKTTPKPVAKTTKPDVQDSKPKEKTLFFNFLSIKPLSMFKVFLPFYLAMHLIFIIAFAFVWIYFSISGLLTTLSGLLENSSFAIDFNSAVGTIEVFGLLIVLSIINSLIWALVSLIMAKIFNICSKFAGGLKIELGQN